MVVSPPETSATDALWCRSAPPLAVAIQEARGPEASEALFSMVCDVGAGRMWVAAGNPCTTPYEEVDLSDVL
jgi:hypothetical protein